MLLLLLLLLFLLLILLFIYFLFLCTPAQSLQAKNFKLSLCYWLSWLSRSSKKLFKKLHCITHSISRMTSWSLDVVIQRKKRDVITTRTCCRKCNIRLNKDKMKLHCNSVPYMWYELAKSILKPDSWKVEAIVKMKPPSDRQGVMRLISLATYRAQCTPGFMDMTSPIRELLKKENDFRWDNTTYGAAFDQLQSMLLTASVLKYCDVTKTLTVQCNTSQKAMDAYILQDEQQIEYA